MTDTLLSFHNKTAGLLFIMAKEAAKRAHKMRGTLGEQMEVVTTIILCAVVAEAAVNEMAEWFEFHRDRPELKISHGLPYGFHDLEVRTKWSLFPLIVRQKTFKRGAEPWQSFEVLIELRNYIMHLRRRAAPNKVQGFLKAKFGGELDFPVAEWACETMAGMFDKLTEMLDLPELWIGLVWFWTPKHSFPYGLTTPGNPWPPDGNRRNRYRRGRKNSKHHKRPRTK
jgi:hypothetical protein